MAVRTLTVWCPDWPEECAFEPVVAALAAVWPRVEVIRPGLAAFATRGPARYFGSEIALVVVAAGTVFDAAGLTARVGIADGPFASALAARESRMVPAGGSAAYLAPFPVQVLGRPELAGPMRRLGIRTLGALAVLPRRPVASWFGASGEVAHRLARGQDERPPTGRTPPAGLTVSLPLDPPSDRIEPATGAATTLAAAFIQRLARHGLTASRVLIEAETEHGARLARLWRHDSRPTAAAVAERVRWQLAGWLTALARERPGVGIVLLRLTPGEVHVDTGDQLALRWPSPAGAAATQAAARLGVGLGSLAAAPAAVSLPNCTPKWPVDDQRERRPLRPTSGPATFTRMG